MIASQRIEVFKKRSRIRWVEHGPLCWRIKVSTVSSGQAVYTPDPGTAVETSAKVLILGHDADLLAAQAARITVPSQRS